MKLDSENNFEDDAMNWLESIGWKVHRTDDEYGGTKLDRITERNKTDVIHSSLLEDALVRLNTQVDQNNVGEVVDEIEDKLKTQKDLIDSNKVFHEDVIERGIDVEVETEDGYENITVQVFDTENPENNRYDAVSQHEFGARGIRPDIVLFINGIPVVISELKDATRGKNVSSAISDLQNYEESHEKLFYPALLNIATTRNTFRYGAIGATNTYYNPWKPEDSDPNAEYGRTGYNVEDCFRSLLNPERILDIIRDFVFYDTIGSNSAKIVPRHQQYFSVKSMFERVEKGKADGKISVSGLVWHTQGSGKSYAMYLAARIASRRKGSKVILLVDDVNLKEQMKKELKRLEPGFDVTISQTQRGLRKDIQGSKDIVLTNIHLFDDINESIKPSKDTYVLVDEAHRFMEKDFGTHLDAALPTDEEPGVHHFGFTGTPVSEENRNTFNNYSMSQYDTDTPYIHRYSMKSGVEEGTIVKVDMVNRDLNWSIDEESMDAEFMGNYSTDRERAEAKKWIDQGMSVSDVTSTESHARAVADDVSEYYDENVSVREHSNKAMVITPSREAASLVGQRLQDIYDSEMVRVLFTKRDSDGDLLKQFHTTEGERQDIQDNFIDDEDPKILVVCSMLLTGFDAPILGTIFMDRQLRDHRLMQAIARANRPNDGKQYGEIVDYWGVTDDIENMYEDLDDEVTLYVSRNKEDFIEEFDQQVQHLMDQCPFDNEGPVKNAEKIYEDKNHDKFREDFKRLRDLIRAIKPDRRILENNREEKYEGFKQVYKTIQAIESEDPNNPPVNIEEIRENAKEAMDENMKVQIGGSTETQLEVDEWMPENMQVRQEQKELQTILRERSKQSPAFKDLSERVEEIIRRWRHEEQSVEETHEQLREVTDELDQRTTPDELNERDWLKRVVRDVVVEVLVREEIDGNIDKGDISDEIVNTVVDAFVEGWEDTRNVADKDRRSKMVQTRVKKKMVQNADQYRQLLNSDFAATVTEYLSNNIDD